MNWNVAVTAVLALAAMPAKGDEMHRIISVTGEGTVSAAPDLATVQTGVVTQAKTAKEALEANNDAMKKVMDVLQDRDIAAKDIQTSNFNVSPVYRQDERGRRLREIEGYQVRNQVTVRVRHLADLGGVLDALVSAGSNEISGVSFGVDDAEGILNQARSRAIQNAKSRAEVFAQAAEVKVGAVRQINEQTAAVPHYPMMAYARADADVSISPGEQEFRVSVNVVFALESESDHAHADPHKHKHEHEDK